MSFEEEFEKSPKMMDIEKDFEMVNLERNLRKTF
jgi:hypothetical protein